MKEELKAIAEIVNSDIAKEVYNDGAKPMVKSIGGIFGTLFGFVDNVVLYPMKKLNAILEVKAQTFKDELEQKLNNIPEEKRCEPDLSIIGPVLEALKYNLDNDEIRIMFENLIANNVNSDIKNKTHPRFVEIIKQMNHFDAVIFKSIIDGETSIILEPRVSIGKDRIANNLPKYISDCPFEIDEFLISATLTNLDNLGLIDIDFLRYKNIPNIYEDCLNKNKKVNDIYSMFYIQQQFLLNLPPEERERNTKLLVNDLTEIRKEIGSKGVISISDFGIMFSDVCLKS